MSSHWYASGTPPRPTDDLPTPLLERHPRASGDRNGTSPTGEGDRHDRTEAFDLNEALAEIPGGFEMAVDLAALFLTECSTVLRQMREALHDDNPRVVRRGAHTLKSSAGIFAAHTMVDAAAQVERLAAEGAVVALTGPMQRLEYESARVMDGLKRLCAGG